MTSPRAAPSAQRCVRSRSRLLKIHDPHRRLERHHDPTCAFLKAHAVLDLLFQTAKFTHARKKRSHKTASLLPVVPFFYFYDHVSSARKSVCLAVPHSNIHPNPVFQSVMEGAVCLLHPTESERGGRRRFCLFFPNTHLTFQRVRDVNSDLSAI